jgi:hypothetical protein
MFLNLHSKTGIINKYWNNGKDIQHHILVYEMLHRPTGSFQDQ